MKRSMICLVIAVVSVVPPSIAVGQSSAKGTSSDREQVLQLERDWTQSFVAMDVATNERIVADDYIGTEPDGKRTSKADLITEVKTGEALVSNHLNEEDVVIHFYGDTAVVKGSESWKRKDGKTGRWIWTDVMVKRNGKWQVVSSQDLEQLDK
jgi:ketosteroid isomerase-like protein